MITTYPSTFDDIRGWARINDVTINEARIRFAQYATLRAIASSQILSQILVFKGGNALDFVWQPNRSTLDLDFSVDMAVVGQHLASMELASMLKETLEPGLKITTGQLGIVFVIHSVKKQPPALDATFVLIEIRVGYALPDQTQLISRMAYGSKSPQIIPIEISLNEPICADQRIDVQGTHRVRVSTIEDIVAEKLRALLQQPIRNRTRPQDLLDIALLIREQPQLDRQRVAEFLLRKSVARGVAVSRSAFYDPDVARRAGNEYETLQHTTRRAFIPFEEALRSLLDFVDTLPLSDETF